MRRLVLPILAMLCLTAWVVAFSLLRSNRDETINTIPTLMVLPSLTPTGTPSPTAFPTETLTATLTSTPTPSLTLPPTATATLAEHLLEISVAVPDVYVEPRPTPFPPGTILLPAPPQPIEPLADATNTAPPFTGWFSFESDYPTVRYSPPWTARLAHYASRGQYHRTETAYSTANFSFEGEGLRVRYVAARNMGLFEIVVDGRVIDTIDAYIDGLTFTGTRVYFVGSGSHILEIRAIGQKNNLSQGYVVGLDAVQVFRGDANTLVLPPPAVTTTPTSLPQAAARIDLVSAPPTAQATWTPIPPRVLAATVIIAYDENGNRTVDPAEGVQGISVRVVETHSNRVIASGYTDARGYIDFELVTDVPARIVVPYFGETWELERGNTNSRPAHTLILTPGNQPGLIP